MGKHATPGPGGGSWVTTLIWALVIAFVLFLLYTFGVNNVIEWFTKRDP